MAIVDPIKIDGLAEFNRSLKKLDSDLPKALRLAGNSAADIVAAYAKQPVPMGPARGGHAVTSIKAKSTRTEARVQGGGAKYAYYPWLDFGGRVGPKKSVRRPFIKSGRYIYPAYTNNKEEIYNKLIQSLIDVAKAAGVEVENE
jgi:hypothetical protein